MSISSMGLLDSALSRIIVPLAMLLFGVKELNAQFVAFDIISTLNYVQTLLGHIGPLLSGTMFIIAGIFYAIGQLFPAQRRANFHSTAIDIIVGAIIVAVLSVASNGLAVASTHLLTNISNTSLI